MSSNEDYLDSLLKSMGDEEGTELNTQMSEEDIAGQPSYEKETAPTLDSIKDFSEDEIAQMLAVTKQPEDKADVEGASFVETGSADNDDLLALLGGLSDDKEINEISDLLTKNENNELVDESIISDYNDEQGFVSEELGALLGGGEAESDNDTKKEERRQKREEKKLEKQRRKQLKKEERLRMKAGKKQQKDAQKLVEELEQEREAAEKAATNVTSSESISKVEAFDLLESVESADVGDIFGAQTADVATVSDISSLLAELEAETGEKKAREEEEPVFAEVEEKDENVGISGEEEPAEDVEFAFDFIEEKADSEKSVKKKGLFSKLFNALTEEDPEENAPDENMIILEELDAEDKGVSKKKKGKKVKGDKKKGKGAEELEEDEEEDKGKGKGKKEKKPKKAKPKKEKPVKAKPSVQEGPARRVSKKSVFVIVLFAATVFGIVYFTVNVLSEMLQLKSAKEAFERQDYVTCYEKLYGLELSEKETEMFKHAELVMKMQRRIAVYDKYMAEEMELEALDSLMRGVASYEELYNKAQAYDAGLEVHAYYMEIIDILEEDYGLSQADAIAIAHCDSNVQYTRYLTALVDGGSVSTGETEGSLQLPEQETDDILPAEEELPTQNFAD